MLPCLFFFLFSPSSQEKKCFVNFLIGFEQLNRRLKGSELSKKFIDWEKSCF